MRRHKKEIIIMICLIYIVKYGEGGGGGGGGGVGVHRAKMTHKIGQNDQDQNDPAEMTRPKRPNAEMTHVQNDPKLSLTIKLLFFKKVFT